MILRLGDSGVISPQIHNFKVAPGFEEVWTVYLTDENVFLIPTFYIPMANNDMFAREYFIECSNVKHPDYPTGVISVDIGNNKLALLRVGGNFFMTPGYYSFKNTGGNKDKWVLLQMANFDVVVLNLVKDKFNKVNFEMCSDIYSAEICGRRFSIHEIMMTYLAFIILILIN